LASPGSALHGTGNCRPCAWFHKAQGCENAAECRHCHICPEGEIKNRKKVKAVSMRHEKSDKVTTVSSEKDDGMAQEPLKVMLPIAGKNVMELPPPPGLPKPASPSTEMPSEGSAAHVKGDCKPCAWFYKAQGCQNGKECRHCHLCPEGEIRSRRKVKVATLRQQDDDEDMTPSTGTHATHADHAALLLQAQQVQHAAVMAAHWGAQALWEAAQWEAAGEALAAAAVAEGSLPSTGSALHHLGKCRPCAWFWKSQGCMNGQACAHCHLCPEGELKERKRVKESAMRMGALLPASATTPTATPLGRTASGRSPRVVQIAPILGA